MCSGHYEASLLKGLDSMMPIHFLLLTPWIICPAEVLITPQIPRAKALRTVPPLQGLIGLGRSREDRRKGLLPKNLSGKQSKLRR